MPPRRLTCFVAFGRNLVFGPLTAAAAWQPRRGRLETIAGFSASVSRRMLAAMMQVPLWRLIPAFLAVASTAAAQTDQQEAQPAPNLATQPGAATTAPAEPVAPPQPQTQPAQPAPNPPAPAYNNPQPYAPSAAATQTNGPRDVNTNNYQTTDNRNSAAFNGGDDAAKPSSKFEMPTISVRVDPFNWLLAGRLGFEIESQVWKFISVELVPQFIVNDQPPYLNLNLIGVPNTLRQKSAGIGALAGTSVGVGFWLNGTPMEGYVLRAELTNYSINYDTDFDHVNYVEREFQVLFGQHSKWGPFTIAGTFGIGSMLNKHERCFSDNYSSLALSPQTSGCPNGKQMLLAVTPNELASGQPGVINLNGWAYPIDLVLRISLGVVF
jgi:hypothetical protein